MIDEDNIILTVFMKTRWLSEIKPIDQNVQNF